MMTVKICDLSMFLIEFLGFQHDLYIWGLMQLKTHQGNWVLAFISCNHFWKISARHMILVPTFAFTLHRSIFSPKMTALLLTLILLTPASRHFPAPEDRIASTFNLHIWG